jgi:hypothetical protein
MTVNSTDFPAPGPCHPIPGKLRMSIPQPRRPLALAIALAVAAGNADAATITVTSSLDDSGEQCTLRQAIGTMTNGALAGIDEGSCRTGAITVPDDFGTNDTIVFDTSAVPAGSTITLTQGALKVLNLASPLSIRGSGQIIDANQYSGVLFVSTATLTASNLTLTGGNYGGGAGAFALDSTMTLNNVIVSNNSSSALNMGGAVLALNSNVTLNSSAVSGNSTALGHGGGVFANSNSTLKLIDSTISGNTAYDAGGLYCRYTTVTLTNSTVAGNSATFNAGLFASHSTVALTQSTVSANSASSSFGGVHAIFGTLALANTIVAGNTSAIAPDFYAYSNPVSATHSVFGTALTASFNNNGNQFSDAPVDALGNNGGPTQTMAPALGSPALNIGDPALAKTAAADPLNYDQRGPGFPRKLPDGTVDIGAYQHQASEYIFADGLEAGP